MCTKCVVVSPKVLNLMAPTHQIEHFAFCGCPPHDANQIEISHYEAFHREHRGKKTLPNFRLLRTFFELVYIFKIQHRIERLNIYMGVVPPGKANKRPRKGREQRKRPTSSVPTVFSTQYRVPICLHATEISERVSQLTVAMSQYEKKGKLT